MINKDELYIGMLCESPQGTGVISWVDSDSRYIYMTDLAYGEHYKVDFEDFNVYVEVV
ncbi:MAG: hypothetical protein ACI8WB_000741 [Phenylobacterium sp.]|jgi:hypothetical protein